jgi:hypothetical protein
MDSINEEKTFELTNNDVEQFERLCGVLINGEKAHIVSMSLPLTEYMVSELLGDSKPLMEPLIDFFKWYRRIRDKLSIVPALQPRLIAKVSVVVYREDVKQTLTPME